MVTQHLKKALEAVALGGLLSFGFGAGCATSPSRNGYSVEELRSLDRLLANRPELIPSWVQKPYSFENAKAQHLYCVGVSEDNSENEGNARQQAISKCPEGRHVDTYVEYRIRLRNGAYMNYTKVFALIEIPSKL